MYGIGIDVKMYRPSIGHTALCRTCRTRATKHARLDSLALTPSNLFVVIFRGFPSLPPPPEDYGVIDQRLGKGKDPALGASE